MIFILALFPVLIWMLDKHQFYSIYFKIIDRQSLIKLLAVTGKYTKIFFAGNLFFFSA